MRTFTSTLALGCLLLAVADTAAAQVEHSVGVARLASDGSIEYVEHHQYRPDGSHRVDYYSSELDVVAWKELTYPMLPWQPRIDQANRRQGTETLVVPQRDRFRMVRTEDGDTEEFFVDRSPGVICDAGFDNYIKEQWPKLVDGDMLKVQFVVAGTPRMLRMRVQSESSETEGLTKFSIKPENFFVRMFVRSIELWYRNDDRMLMRFTGFSNLSGGDREVVDIQFDHYQTEAVLEQPLAEWLPQSMRQAGVSD